MNNSSRANPRGSVKKNAAYILLLSVMLVGVFVLLQTQSDMSSRIAQAEEDVRPAQLQIIKLAVPDCLDCFDTGKIVEALESEPVEIEDLGEVMFDSEEGRKLISKYNIAKVPTVVLRGEIEKENAKEFLSKHTELKEDVLIWTTIPPVYMDTQTEELVGFVSLTFLADETCEDCYNPKMHKQVLENQFGVVVVSERILDVGSVEGRELVDEYEIINVPTVLLSEEASVYPTLMSAWKSVGTVEEDDVLVFRDLSVFGDIVYKDMETGEKIEPTQQ